MKINLIPFIDNHRISKSGEIYRTVKGEEPVKIDTYWKKYLMVDIEGVTYRVDDLICRTYYGPIGFPVEYKDKDIKNCCFDNLRYEITSYDEIDEFIYLNKVAIPFKLIPGSNREYISPNGVVYSYYKMGFKPHNITDNDYHKISVNCDGVNHPYAHRIVYRTWVGEIGEKLVIDHVDGRKWNNSILNLEMVTSGENNQRAFSTGLKDLTWSKEIIHVLCRMIEKNYRIQDMYNILGVADDDKDGKFQITALINKILYGEVHRDISSLYNLSEYDVKKNHYSKIENDGRRQIIERLLLETDFSQYKIANIVDISRGTVEYVKHKLRKQGLVA